MLASVVGLGAAGVARGGPRGTAGGEGVAARGARPAEATAGASPAREQHKTLRATGGGDGGGEEWRGRRMACGRGADCGGAGARRLGRRSRAPSITHAPPMRAVLPAGLAGGRALRPGAEASLHGGGAEARGPRLQTLG